MSEDVARALGAGIAAPVIIAGKECKVRPLTALELCEVERECVKQYKRAYLEDYKANLDLLEVADRGARFQEKYDEVMEWDTENLPTRFAYQPEKIALTPAFRAEIANIMSLTEPDKVSDKVMRKYGAAMLDGKMISIARYKELTGVDQVPRVSIAYTNWWITGSVDGMITFIWVCFKPSGVTKAEVAAELMKPEAKSMMVAVSREIERLSAPQASFG